MTDVFISYSRKDYDFGRRLHTKLTEEKRDVWMDWEDIPPTVEWWDKIREGILAADNIIFIISPKSIASAICNLEIAYARELNKRVVPILYCDTDEKQAFVELVTKPLNDFQRAMLQDRDLLTIARDNWNILAGLNWINFTDEPRFEEKTQELLKAVNTDFEYVDDHTRLLVRASDWEDRKGNPSLLLRDDDLTAAETWLGSAGDKRPQPTTLQRNYITESRRIENQLRRRIRRLQRASVIFGVMLIVAVIVSAFAGLTTANALSTQATVEFQATYFALEQGRAATLAAGGVILPPLEQTRVPQDFIATVTQIAVLNNWKPVAQEFDGVEMVQVPSGCFWMGSILPGNSFLWDERPVNEVCFNEPFWIDRYEVTNEQFSQFDGLSLVDNRPGPWPQPKQPRTSINWFEARDFCELRGARLPTEAEWEYVARGPNNRLYPWGNEFVEENVVISYPMADEPGNVGSRPGNISWVGAYDLSGNVAEWVSTIFGGYPYPVPGSDEERDVWLRSDDTAYWRVSRGSDFSLNEYYLRVTLRFSSDPNTTDGGLGFRCVLSE